MNTFVTGHYFLKIHAFHLHTNYTSVKLIKKNKNVFVQEKTFKIISKPLVFKMWFSDNLQTYQKANSGASPGPIEPEAWGLNLHS